MIKLSVHDYCQKCHHFKVAVDKPEKVEDIFGETEYYGDYIICCKYREICEDLLKIIKERSANNNGL